MKITEELKQKILEICADNIGLTRIIATELSLTSEKANRVMDKFIIEGLVMKDPSHKNEHGKILKKNEKGNQFWYELTPLGKKTLHTLDDSFEIMHQKIIIGVVEKKLKNTSYKTS